MTLDRAFIKAFDAPAQEPHRGDEKVAPPHTPSKPIRTRLGGSAARTNEIGASAKRDPIAVPPPRPLSSFTPQPKLHDGCRPLLEVDRLQWPQAVQQLLVRCGRQCEPFIEQLIERMASGQKCLAFTSVNRGEGRTTTTLALARQLAARGMRPLLIDGDSRRPGLAKACGVAIQTGWDDVVASELPPGEALIAAVEEGVTLMPWRTASELALPTTGRVTTLMQTLREQADLLLIDLGPLAGKTAVADLAAFVAAAHVDALYLVCDASTERGPLVSACGRMRHAGLQPAGVIENFVVPGAERPAATAPLSVAHGS